MKNLKRFILFCLIVGGLILAIPAHSERYDRPQEVYFTALEVLPEGSIVPSLKPKKAPTARVNIEIEVQRIFGEKAPVALAVLKHESGLNPKAKGYNCRYNGKSKSCKKEDRHLAWSVDCGIGQINTKGQECPDYLLTVEGSMKAIEKKYKSEGLEAWVSYTSGAYKKFL